MKKNYIKMILGALLSLNMIIMPVSAETIQGSNGWTQQGSSWYYLQSNGVKTTGWTQIGVDWYYFWSTGQMATGWIKSGDGNWYYLTSNGAMASNTVVNGYYVNSSGAWVSKPSGNIYTGSAIKQKLYSLGFADKRVGVVLSPNGGNGLDQDDQVAFSVLSDGRDISLSVYSVNSDIEKKIKTILHWILPTQADNLYSIVDNATESQTLELDGRTVTINIQKTFTTVVFGPIK